MKQSFEKIVFAIGLFASISIISLVAGRDDELERATEEWSLADDRDDTFIQGNADITQGDSGADSSPIDVVVHTIPVNELPHPMQAAVHEYYNTMLPALDREQRVVGVDHFDEEHCAASGWLNMCIDSNRFCGVCVGSLIFVVGVFVVRDFASDGMFTEQGQTCMRFIREWCDVFALEASRVFSADDMKALCVKVIEIKGLACHQFSNLVEIVTMNHPTCPQSFGYCQQVFRM
jgi:hypothetical protein